MTAALPLIVLLLLQQARDVVPRPQAAATLAGVVVADDAEGRPVRRARVSVASGETGRTAITDDEGRFAFTGLPEGSYTVSVTRPGWVSMQYGARRPQRPGTPVRLKTGERSTITIRLPRGAAITGTISEQDGRPAPNVSVSAMRWSFERGERRLVTAGSSFVSDDRGVYRIYGLPAGDYIVGAAYGTGGRAAVGELQLTTDLDVRYATGGPQPDGPAPRAVDLAPVYFPGTASPLEATPVSVRAGEERAGVDMTLQLVPTARVEGTVSALGGLEGTVAAVTLMATAPGALLPGVPAATSWTIPVQDDGAFQFTNVAPGPYTLIARTRGPDPLSAVTSLMIEGNDISGIDLALGSGISISGGVRFESPAGTAVPDARTVVVTLQPLPGQPSITISPADATVEADGAFVLKGITPGAYRLGASVGGRATRSGWFVKTATVDGRDAVDAPVALAGNAYALVVLTDRMAELGGRLQNAGGGAAPGYTIVLFPEDHALWVPGSRRIQALRPAADGSYRFRNIPGGTYLLTAVDEADPGAWYDPAWLQALVPAAMRLAIGDGQLVEQDLQLTRPR